MTQPTKTTSVNYAELIETAQKTVYDVCIKTPLTYAKGLSQKQQNQIFLKREDMQPVFSFKCRGAYNHISQLSAEALAKGVICSSAGNHAQGVALAAKELGTEALIVMPKTTPGIKVKAVEALGGTPYLYGDIYDEAYAKAIELAEEKNLTYIHPYDTPKVIAGQATVGVEILEQSKEAPDYIFVPIGGGGLIAGISSYVKAKSPNTKIIAVEAEDSPTFYKAREAGKRVVLPTVGIFADGTAVKQIGEETFRVANPLVDDCILVNTNEICAAIKDIFENTRTLVEPAGALATAGIKSYIKKHQLSGKTMVAINSGANVNFDRLRYISELAEMGENREIIFSATIPERTGSFKTFCQLIGNVNVSEFNYRYADHDQAQIFVGIEFPTGTDAERNNLLSVLAEQGYNPIDLTNNDVAKLHIKHMVGGKSPDLENERLFRVQFPERPGALMKFLQHMNPAWNISLFHYRNYGSNFGRVLVGIQVPPEDNADFEQFRDALGYTFIEETENPAYRLFL